MGFKYDNVLMEEAAQILEIETFIPLVLQNQDPEAPPRLKSMFNSLNFLNFFRHNILMSA